MAAKFHANTLDELPLCRRCNKPLDDCQCVLVCECGHDIDIDADYDVCECERCLARHESADWIDATAPQVAALAAENDWEFDEHSCRFARDSLSRYYDLTRECDTCLLGKLDVDCTCESLNLRISDHGSAYCREDISLAMNPGGDDSTMDFLAARLARMKTAEAVRRVSVE